MIFSMYYKQTYRNCARHQLFRKEFDGCGWNSDDWMRLRSHRSYLGLSSTPSTLHYVRGYQVPYYSTISTKKFTIILSTYQLTASLRRFSYNIGTRYHMENLVYIRSVIPLLTLIIRSGLLLYYQLIN